MHENKTFFCYIFFFDVSTKNRYFHTGTVSLPYKNTNHIDKQCIQKITDLNNSFEENFPNGPDPAHKETGPKSAQHKMGLL